MAAMSEPRRIEVPVRVRYSECDAMQVAHHAAYPVWLEIARTELLRAKGRSYAEMERRGVYFVVARMNVRYRRPARYDDELTITCVSQPTAGVKIDHDYQVKRGDELLAVARTTIVCVNAEGKARPVPADLFE
jgi:acyl-CoA thioester hydrolase